MSTVDFLFTLEGCCFSFHSTIAEMSGLLTVFAFAALFIFFYFLIFFSIYMLCSWCKCFFYEIIASSFPHFIRILILSTFTSTWPAQLCLKWPFYIMLQRSVQAVHTFYYKSWEASNRSKFVMRMCFMNMKKVGLYHLLVE